MGELTLIEFYGSNTDIAAVVAEIAVRSVAADRRTVVVDVSGLVPPPRWRIDAMLETALDVADADSPVRVLKRRSKELGFDVMTVTPQDAPDVDQELEKLLADLPSSMVGLEAWAPYGGLLGRSLASFLATQVALSYRADPHKYVRQIAKQIRCFLKTHATFCSAIGDDAAHAEVFAQNGRFPIGASVIAAAQTMGAKPMWFERGRHGYFFAEDFSPHDIHGPRLHGRSFFEGLDPSFREDLLTRFVDGRRKSKEVNPFLQVPKTQHVDVDSVSGSTPQQRHSKHAVVFTSSPDELVGVLPPVTDGAYSDQYQALRAGVMRLLDCGFAVTVRIHPNIMNKSWAALLESVRAFRDLPVRIILPSDAVDSYPLMLEADVILVWVSTIGLEALASGKTVYVMGRSRYAAMTSVPTIRYPQELSSQVFGAQMVPLDEVAPAIVWISLGGRLMKSDISHQIEKEFSGFSVRRRRRAAFLKPLKLLSLPWVLAYRGPLVLPLAATILPAPTYGFMLRGLLGVRK